MNAQLRQAPNAQRKIAALLRAEDWDVGRAYLASAASQALRTLDPDYAGNAEKYITIATAPPPPMLSGGTPVSGPPNECKGEWKLVAADQFGWYDTGTWVNASSAKNRQAREDHYKGTAPDGSAAVEHRILKEKPVYSPELASPLLLKDSNYCAVMIRYNMFNENNKWRTQRSGKYMSIMGGRGQAGGSYLNRYNHPEGWSSYLLSTVVSGTVATPSAKAGLLMGVGSANRSRLGASCGGAARIGGDPIGGNAQRCFERFTGRYNSPLPTGEWMTIEQVVVMNDRNTANGSTYYTLNGRELGRLDGVMWAMNPTDAPGVFMEWRTMYGGTPEEELPVQDFKEWFKDFEFLVIEE